MTQPHVACRTLPGRAFRFFLASPGLMAADNRAAKSTNDAEETITVVADGAQQSATSGYQPLNSRHRDANLDAAAGYSPVVNTVSDRVLEDQHATSLDEALYNVANVVQTNTLGGTGRLYPPRLRRQPRRLDHDQRPAHRAAAQL